MTYSVIAASDERNPGITHRIVYGPPSPESDPVAACYDGATADRIAKLLNADSACRCMEVHGNRSSTNGVCDRCGRPTGGLP